MDSPTIRVPIPLRRRPTDRSVAFWWLGGTLDEHLDDILNWPDKDIEGVSCLQLAWPSGPGLILKSSGAFGTIPRGALAFSLHTGCPQLAISTSLSATIDGRAKHWRMQLRIPASCLALLDASLNLHVVPDRFVPLASQIAFGCPKIEAIRPKSLGDVSFAFETFEQADAEHAPMVTSKASVRSKPTAPFAALSTSMAPEAKPSVLPAKRSKPNSSTAGDRQLLAAGSRGDRTILLAAWRRWAEANPDGQGSHGWMNAAWHGDGDALLRWAMAASRDPANAGETPQATAWVACALLANGKASDTNELHGQLQFIREFEHRLPVRAVWLAHLGAAREFGGDVLLLAACRDRLSTRLQDGVDPSVDLPADLFASLGPAAGESSSRIRGLDRVARAAVELLERCQATVARFPPGWFAPLEVQQSFANGLFARAADRLGQLAMARTLDRRSKSPVAALHRADSSAAEIRVARRCLARWPSALSLPANLEIEVQHVVAALVGLRAHWPARSALRLDVAEAEPLAGILPGVVCSLLDGPDDLDRERVQRWFALLPPALELLPEALRLGGMPHRSVDGLTTAIIRESCRMAMRFAAAGPFERWIAAAIDLGARSKSMRAVLREASAFVGCALQHLELDRMLTRWKKSIEPSEPESLRGSADVDRQCEAILRSFDSHRIGLARTAYSGLIGLEPLAAIDRSLTVLAPFGVVPTDDIRTFFSNESTRTVQRIARDLAEFGLK